MKNLFLIITLAGFCQNIYAEIVERIVVVVNSEAVLLSDIPKLKLRIKKRALLDENLIPEQQNDFFSGKQEELLAYLINEKIMDSEVKRLNLTVTDDKVEQRIKEIAKNNNVSVDEVLSAVTAEGVSADEYKHSLKSQIERQSLIENEVISRLRISDEDAMSEYLKKNPSSKPIINEFTISHIFFSPKKSGAEAALKRATEVLGKLRTGESFESLAEQFSEDPNFSKGGFLGTFKAGEFLSEVESSILNLSPGEYSTVVKSRMGFHIVKLLSKNIGVDPKFEREKDRIKSQILNEAFKRQLKIWLQNKKEEAFLKINGE